MKNPLTFRQFRRASVKLVHDLFEACWSAVHMVEGSTATLARLQRPKRAQASRENRHAAATFRRAPVPVRTR